MNGWNLDMTVHEQLVVWYRSYYNPMHTEREQYSIPYSIESHGMAAITHRYALSSGMVVFGLVVAVESACPPRTPRTQRRKLTIIVPCNP